MRLSCISFGAGSLLFVGEFVFVAFQNSDGERCYDVVVGVQEDEGNSHSKKQRENPGGEGKVLCTAELKVMMRSQSS